MCARVVVQGLLAGTMLAVALAPPADAQSGLGRAKNRPPEQAPPREQSAKEEPAPGEYSFNGPDVIEAVSRGEGPQALAYFERAAKEAEQQGNLIREARAWHCASIVTLRLGRYQKAIQSSSRAIELFKKASGLSQQDQMAWASAYSHLGGAYRQVGDLVKGRQAFEDGLAYVKANMSGRFAGLSEGYLLNDLGTIAFIQKDYQKALAYNTQAAHYFETVESSRMAARMPEQRRTTLRRWTANSFFGIGRAQLALGHPDEADVAFAKGLTYARLTGLREVEMKMLSAQANNALSRKDWARALDLYRQSIGIVNQMQLVRGVPALYQGQSRALEGLGRIDEALVSTREAVRQIEEIRADLTDSDLRSAFFEDKQGIYQRAVSLALQAQRPEEAFELSEQSRSRAFLDLLGSQTTLSKGRTRALVAEEVQLRARLSTATTRASSSASGRTTSSRPRSCRWSR